ncbi:glycosyltransferase [Halomarina pelagica]|uniref:glycosyltransferase n=1 Tax=Halomarina pelagica TaxID=2961599 RepID=UPI0020C38E8B|nr:glycosyltransferase [Halomarina sp. BND7]
MISELFTVVLIISLSLCVYAYIGYPVVLLGLIFFSTALPDIDENTDFLPSVTMVVAAHNEATIIKQKLRNIEQIDYEGEFNCLVVSDSTDNTDTLVERFKGPRTSLLSLGERKGKSYALNVAASTANGDVLVFSDANTMFDSDALSTLIKPLSDQSIGCVTGSLRLIDAQSQTIESIYWRYELWLRQLETDLGTTVSINGGMLAIRRKDFDPLPECAVTDDMVTALREASTDRRIVFVPGATATEYTAGGLWEEYSRRKRIGVGNYQTLVWFANLLNPAHSLTAFEFVSHKVLRWCMPFLLGSLTLSNVILVILSSSPVFDALMVLQSVFYLLAAIGMISSNLRSKPIFSMPSYFVVMNIAFTVGIWKFLMGVTHDVWEATPRVNDQVKDRD